MIGAVIRFPRLKKRGAKVRRGPSAQMLHFPAPLSGTELYAEWQWLSGNSSGWRDEKLPEPKDLAGFDKKKFDRHRELNSMVREAMGREPKTDDDLRRDIADYRALIEKRVQVKDWLETRGVNWGEVKNPEQALFFIFDRMQASEQPASA
jgi:hypothetical protein